MGAVFGRLPCKSRRIFAVPTPAYPVRSGRLMALSAPFTSYVRSAPGPGATAGTGILWPPIIDPLIAFVSANAWLAYLTLFLAALLEAVPVVGSVIPGSTIILALSALIPGGELALGWVLAAATAGALIGDGSAYWIGHRAQREILNSLAADELSAGDRAERGLLQPLGGLGGVFRPLRAADPRLRADHGRRARHAAVAVLRRQHSGHPAVGAGACAARRAGGLRPAPLCRPAPSCRDRAGISGYWA